MTSRSAAARGVSPSSSLPLGSTHSLRLRKRTTAISGVPSRRSTIPPAARTGARTISRPMSAIFETRSDRQYSGARLKVEIATHLLANETIRGPDAALTLPRLIFRWTDSGHRAGRHGRRRQRRESRARSEATDEIADYGRRCQRRANRFAKRSVRRDRSFRWWGRRQRKLTQGCRIRQLWISPHGWRSHPSGLVTGNHRAQVRVP